MITYVSGGFFSSPAQMLVNTVNTVGVMGKGLAKEFRTVWSEMFDAYAERCEAGDLVPGALHLWRSPHKWVLNFPTKRHWRQRSRPEDIEAGLRTFAATWVEYGTTSVAFPQLGCGNGGLDWETQVRPLMERRLAPLPIDVYIHVADATPLVPEGPEGEALVAWLRGEPAIPSFARFWDGLIAAVENGSPGWSIDGDTGAYAADGAVPSPITREDWHRVWRELTSGGLLDADGSALVGVPADAVFALLERASGVAPVRAVRVDARTDQGHAQVSRLLAEPTARAVRYDPISDNVPAPARPGGDGNAPWIEKATTPPSQLSFIG